MKSRLTIAISGAILAHFAAGMGLSFFQWQDRSAASVDPSAEALPEPQFMTLPERAELLLTPTAPSPPAETETDTEPDIEAPQEASLADESAPLPTDIAPTPAPAEAPSQQRQQEQQRQLAENEERDRLRTLRLQAAEKALAEARQQSVPEKTQSPRAPAPAKSKRSPTTTAKIPADPRKRQQQQASPAPQSPPQAPPAPQGETRGPVTVRQSQPSYPRALERKGIGGKVSVMINVDPKGRVTSAAVNRSSGHDELDNAAITAVKKWRFKPALKNGNSIASKTAVEIVFQPQ